MKVFYILSIYNTVYKKSLMEAVYFRLNIIEEIFWHFDMKMRCLSDKYRNRKNLQIEDRWHRVLEMYPICQAVRLLTVAETIGQIEAIW